jgi:hypothetical protein
MSDLRTRIAAVLSAHQDESDTGPDCTCGWVWHGENLWRKSYADHLAGAVIRELGLTRVTRSERVPIHRYVTEWKADDNGVNP